MITYKERESLSTNYLLENGFAGYDCNGNPFKIGDSVEVIKEEKLRENNSRWQYCSNGKKGKVVKGIGYFANWVASIKFTNETGEENTAGCTDFYLLKV